VRFIAFVLLAGCAIAQSRAKNVTHDLGASLPPSTSAVVIDGELNDSFWSRIRPGELSSAESGVDPATSGEIRAALAGGYLYVAARFPEPTGRFTARSIGRNPQWEQEDSLALFIRAVNENDWILRVNALGAYSVQWRWTGESDWYIASPEKCEGFLVAAARGPKEWRIEAAIPLARLGSPEKGTVHISAERIRAGRPGMPAERWHWPGEQPLAEVPGLPRGRLPAPIFRPPALGNDEPPIEVGHRGTLPSPDSKWTDDVWRRVPVWTLYRNEPGSRAPQFQTEVKLVQDGHTLAVMARCAEPHATVAWVRERDGPVDQDDSFQIYLATTGSSYVKYAINALGYIQDATGFSG